MWMQNHKIQLSTFRLSRKSNSFSHNYRNYVFPIGFNVNSNTDYLLLNFLKDKRYSGQTFLFLNVYKMTKFHGNIVTKWRDMRHGYLGGLTLNMC